LTTAWSLMSSRLLSHSPDLQHLLSDGYSVEIRSNTLLLHDIPYVRPDKTVGFGVLVSTLNLAGEKTVKPDTHVAYWAGEFPCDAEGCRMDYLGTPNQGLDIDASLKANHMFSRRPQPTGAYVDYYQKMTTYVAMITGEAQRIDPSATAQPGKPIRPSPDTSVFEYLETSSARSGIGPINSKLDCGRLAIVGLGGTGSYVLDLVAKTPVREIHLFDGDLFLTHNAFRSPGAPTIDELEIAPKKVDWFKAIYSKMRRGIFAHGETVDSTNIAELESMSFVFLCLDPGPEKKNVVDFLTEKRMPFIDVGVGLTSTGECLSGSIRVTRSTREKSDHVGAIVPVTGAGPDDYDKNIQVADMNALNAALAVVRWKKELGFYADFRNEYSMVYSVVTNTIINDEIPDQNTGSTP
jgi:ThiF family